LLGGGQLLFASVTREAPADCSEVMAVAGAKKSNDLGWGSGHEPSVIAVSRFTMLRLTPARSVGTPVPRVVAGSAAWRSPNVLPEGKLTSRPNAIVTRCPTTCQSGSSRGLTLGAAFRW
jgi:hypothetical protein